MNDGELIERISGYFEGHVGRDQIEGEIIGFIKELGETCYVIATNNILIKLDSCADFGSICTVYKILEHYFNVNISYPRYENFLDTGNWHFTISV